MVTVKLLEVPDEVQLKILENADPQDIRSCQSVCRTFYNLIVSSPQIQYILSLDTLGYAMPSVPRLDLTTRQMIEFLERHRRNWSFPGNLQPTEYVIQLSDAGNVYRFDGGVYTHSLHIAPNSRTSAIVGLHFYQLPSPNLGLEFREWCIPNLGLSARGFDIDTAQDLLILVELANPIRSWSEGCWIHLRTMSDNSQHPNAALPFLIAEFTESEGDLESRIIPMLFDIEVVGSLLAILFRSRTQQITSWVIVWDWNRGVEVTRISTGTRSYLGSFTLLSQNKLLLPRCSKSYYIQEDVPGDTFGSLDIYIFDPQATTSTPPRMIASFGLPKLGRTSCHSELRIDSDQRHRIASPHADKRPKVYDLAGRDRLIVVNVRVRSFTHAFEYVSQEGVIYVPANAFLHPQPSVQSPGDMDDIAVDHDDNTKVRWDAWAHLTAWDGWDPVHILRAHVYGQRAALFSSFHWGDEEGQSEVKREVLLLDFNQRRVWWAKSGKESETEELCFVSGGVKPFYFGSRDHVGNLEFSGAGAEYVRRALRVPSGPFLTTVQQIMIDDEHVVVQKLAHPSRWDSYGKLSIHVYTF